MTVPYTYLLRHKPTNTFYYGVKWASGCNPLTFWKDYFTSSKKVSLLRTLFGDDSFEFEIRKTFSTGKAAAKWEKTVLRRMRVLENPTTWINRTTNSAWLYDIHPQSGKAGWSKGKKRPEITIALKGKPRKDLIGKAPWNKGKTGVQVAWNRGKSPSEETKKKHSETNKRIGIKPPIYRGKVGKNK